MLLEGASKLFDNMKYIAVTKNDVTACLYFVGKRQLPYHTILLFLIVKTLNRFQLSIQPYTI